MKKLLKLVTKKEKKIVSFLLKKKKTIVGLFCGINLFRIAKVFFFIKKHLSETLFDRNSITFCKIVCFVLKTIIYFPKKKNNWHPTVHFQVDVGCVIKKYLNIIYFLLLLL